MRNRALALSGVILLWAPAGHAAETCPVEIKLLLSPSSTRTVIASLGLHNEATGRVYFFDTPALDLLMRGILVRVRQGARNDLTVKVRLPKADQRLDAEPLHGRFPCEIDRTRSEAFASYAIRRKYKAARVPETGIALYRLLDASQIQLLQEASVPIDWGRVARIADIKSTEWQTSAQSPWGPLALELWEWPAGEILELSAKVGSAAEGSRYAELERLVKEKDLTLSPIQDSKSSAVLRASAHRLSP